MDLSGRGARPSAGNERVIRGVRCRREVLYQLGYLGGRSTLVGRGRSSVGDLGLPILVKLPIEDR